MNTTMRFDRPFPQRLLAISRCACYNRIEVIDLLHPTRLLSLALISFLRVRKCFLASSAKMSAIESMPCMKCGLSSILLSLNCLSIPLRPKTTIAVTLNLIRSMNRVVLSYSSLTESMRSQMLIAIQNSLFPFLAFDSLLML